MAVESRLDCEALLALLRTQPDLRVLGGAITLPEALAVCVAQRPRVLLLSTLLGDAREVPATAVLRLAVPDTRIVVLAAHQGDRDEVPARAAVHEGEERIRFPDERQARTDAALASGAVRAVLRDAGPAGLFAVIREAAIGPPWAANGLFANRSPARLLTRQEHRVAWRVGEGDSNKEIAAALRISELTVKKHISHVLRKLGLHDRLQLGLCVARHPLAFREEALRAR